MKKLLIVLISTILMICLSTINVFGDDGKSVEISYVIPAQVTIDDGTNSYVVEVELNNKIDKPKDPNKPGFKFVGWYYCVGSEEYKWNFDEMVLTSDLLTDGISFRLFAKYVEGKPSSDPNTPIEEDIKTIDDKKVTPNNDVVENEENIINETIVVDNYLSASLEFSDDCIPLSETEKKVLEEGGSIKIMLTTVELVEPESDVKELIVNLAKEEDLEIGCFFEVNLSKRINDEIIVVSLTNDAVRITINVPNEMYSEDREFVVIRTHKNNDEYEADIIYKGKANKDKTITFESDKFSIYSLTYQDLKTDTIIEDEDKSYTNLIIVGVTVVAIGGLYVLFKKRKMNRRK